MISNNIKQATIYHLQYYIEFDDIKMLDLHPKFLGGDVTLPGARCSQHLMI